MALATTTRKQTPAMQRAMEKLTGTLDGKVHRSQGVALQTARALAARGLVHLEITDCSWTMVLIEPEVQEITDQQLADAFHGESDLTVIEAETLRPLDPRSRYRALRHAHIARQTYGTGERGVRYGDAARSRAAVLANRVRVVLGWKSGKISDREYGRYLDLAGRQWKAARTHVTDTWAVGTGYGEAVLTVEAPTSLEAEVKARAAIAADPVGYRELVKGFGMRRMTVGELVASRRA